MKSKQQSVILLTLISVLLVSSANRNVTEDIANGDNTEPKEEVSESEENAVVNYNAKESNAGHFFHIFYEIAVEIQYKIAGCMACTFMQLHFQDSTATNFDAASWQNHTRRNVPVNRLRWQARAN